MTIVATMDAKSIRLALDMELVRKPTEAELGMHPLAAAVGETLYSGYVIYTPEAVALDPRFLGYLPGVTSTYTDTVH